MVSMAEQAMSALGGLAMEWFSGDFRPALARRIFPSGVLRFSD